MQVTLQNFSTLVRNMSASAQGASAALTDFTVGSATRAILEASASVALWLQFLILQVMTMCRLATSTGADVDSFVADYGLVRLPGVAATGTVTMSSLAPTQQSGVVTPGMIVRSADGSRQYSVVENDSLAAWSPQAGAYLRPAGTTSIDVAVVATVPGLVGNVQPGVVNLLGQSIPGIDTVFNADAFVDGLDPESDASVQARFANFLDTRSRATTGAIRDAVAGVQQGLSCVVIENQDTAGDPRPGAFVVVVDDGSGTPPAAVIAAAAAAIEPVRPVGSGYAVIPPTLLVANVSMTVTLDPSAYTVGSGSEAIVAAIVAALSAYIGALPVGAPLAFSRLAGFAYGASPLVTNVAGVALNGGTADLGGGATQVVRPGTVSVS